jgi:DNA repair protein RadC
MIKFKSQLPRLELKYIPTDVNKVKITSSQDANQFLRYLFNADTIEYAEEFIAVFVNNANNTIGYMVMEGTTNSTLICIHRLFSEALLCGAHGIILAHNHPSGQLRASDADIKLTSEVAVASKFLKIKLLDHLILTKSSYLSLTDEGIIQH